jgi:hypothetical protein
MGQQLGCRSPFVLAKLGYDLRGQLEDTFSSPLPPRLKRLADQLDGYVAWRDVGAPPQADPEPSPSSVWRAVVEADRSFPFS